VSAIPASLDHLILGVSDLALGIRWVEERTGIRAALGGVHPGRGTHNALLSLGPRCYLEILAPDPAQQTLAWFRDLPNLSEPRLVGWMSHPGELTSLAESLRQSGSSYEGPRESSRQRPDGRTLRWKLLRLADDSSGLLPVLIEWSSDSLHPAEDAPIGCSLLQFEISSPDPEQVQKTLRAVGITLPISFGDRPQFRARIAGPKGTLDLISADSLG
jgi:hypothetical protein